MPKNTSNNAPLASDLFGKEGTNAATHFQTRNRAGGVAFEHVGLVWYVGASGSVSGPALCTNNEKNRKDYASQKRLQEIRFPS
eukprot:1161846-Pelagomonas_calceolata.AAC.11